MQTLLDSLSQKVSMLKIKGIIDMSTQKLKFFSYDKLLSFKGCIGRVDFLVTSAKITLMFLIFLGVISFWAVENVLDTIDSKSNSGYEISKYIRAIATLIAVAIYTWSSLAQIVKRLRSFFPSETWKRVLVILLLLTPLGGLMLLLVKSRNSQSP